MVRYGAFQPLKWAILQAEMVHIAKRKDAHKVRLLIFNILRKPLIFRVFASEGESVCKYELIFRGRTEN